MEAGRDRWGRRFPRQRRCFRLRSITDCCRFMNASFRSNKKSATMIHRLFFLFVALTAGIHAVRAEIILEEAPQDAKPTIRKIDVPKPKDAPTGEKPAIGVDLLRFANNDTLHGSLLAYDKTSGVRWQSAES